MARRATCRGEMHQAGRFRGSRRMERRRTLMRGLVLGLGAIALTIGARWAIARRPLEIQRARRIASYERWAVEFREYARFHAPVTETANRREILDHADWFEAQAKRLREVGRYDPAAEQQVFNRYFLAHPNLGSYEEAVGKVL